MDSWLEEQLQDQDGERICNCIRQVWNKLPERDQAALRGLVQFQTNGGKGLDCPAGCIWRDEAGSEDEGHYIVAFQPYIDKDEAMSDAFLRYLVAHELAHAILRHSKMSLFKAVFWNYTDEQKQQMHLVFEDHVNFQVLEWGFKDELKAQHAFEPHHAARWYDPEENYDTAGEQPISFKKALRRLLDEEAIENSQE